MCLPLHHSALFKNLRPPRDDRRFRFTLETRLSNNHKYDLMNVENRLTTKRLISPKQKILIYENLTLTYSVFLDKPVNVALAVEHRCADLEERDTSA